VSFDQTLRLETRECELLDERLERHAVRLRENRTHPHAGGLRPGAYADSGTREVIDAQLAALRIIDNAALLKACGDDGWQQHDRLVVRLRLQIRDDRHLADVERLSARHGCERTMNRLDVSKHEFERRIGYGARFQAARMRIGFQRGRQAQA